MVYYDNTPIKGSGEGQETLPHYDYSTDETLRDRKRSPHLKVAHPSETQQGLRRGRIIGLKPARAMKCIGRHCQEGKKGKNQPQNLGIKVHACNSCSWETEAGELPQV